MENFVGVFSEKTSKCLVENMNNIIESILTLEFIFITTLNGDCMGTKTILVIVRMGTSIVFQTVNDWSKNYP